MQWSADGGLRWGAALAYYALFSTAPLLLIAINVAALVFGAVEARQRVQNYVTEQAGPAPGEAIAAILRSASEAPGHTWAPVVSYALLAFGAIGMFVHLRTALYTIWRLEPRHANSFFVMILDYLAALAMVLFVGVFLLAALVSATAVPAVRAYLGDELPGGGVLWQVVELLVSFVLLTVLFAGSYRVLSGWRVAWHDIWPGAVLAALLFTIGKTLLGYYLAFAGIASSYGAAGSVVVFLVWVYYSSQVFFYGAEVIQVRRAEATAGPTRA